MDPRRRLPRNTSESPARKKLKNDEKLTQLNRELQKRNHELSVARDELLNLLGSINMPILLLDNNLHVRHLTPSTQKLLNVTSADTGRPLGDIRMNFELPGFQQLILDSIKGATAKEVGVQDREGCWYCMRIFPHKTAENKVGGAIITWFEMTEIKEALGQSAQRWRFLFERNLAGVFYLRNGRIIDCNDAFAHILGYSSREEALKTENWEVHIRSEERESLRERLLQEKSLYGVEVCLKRLDGTPVWVLVSINLMAERPADSKIEEAAGILIDITRSVQAERQLLNLSNHLMKAADDKGRSLARELHDEVGSRLAGLSANLAALERTKGLEDNLRKRLSECRELAQQCANEIHTVSYLQHPLILDDLGLAAAVLWYAADFSRRSGMTVETDIADSVGRLPGEMEIALFRIIQECLTNIQRHSGSRAARVRIDRTDEDLLVEVRDFGKGFKGDKEGMGITGMKGRMREFGGRLEIESGEEGTTVRALLPLSSLER